MMHLTRVDLPAPFSPSTAWNDPAGTESDTSSSATSGPKRLPMPTVDSEMARDAATGAAEASATLMLRLPDDRPRIGDRQRPLALPPLAGRGKGEGPGQYGPGLARATQ